MTTLEHQLQTAISCHGMWKTRLRQAIEARKSEVPAATVARTDVCEFGKWLNGAGKMALGDRAAAERIVRLHSEFHAEAARIVRLAEGGDAATANAALAIGGSYSRASAALVLELKKACTSVVA